MAHGVETSLTYWPPLTLTGYSRNQLSCCNSNSAWTVKSYNRSTSMVYSYAGRDASHHTEPDSYGWRQPTAYWGYRWMPYGQVSIGSPYYGANTGTWGQFGSDIPLYAYLALPTGFTSTRPSFPSLRSQAITAALAELGSSTAELGVELREAQKTADFVGNLLEDLVSAAKSIRTGRIPRGWKRKWKEWTGDIPRSFDRTFCSKWLEYRYAWSPMVLGVYDALDLLERQAEPRRHLTTVRKRAESVSVSTSSSSTTHGIGQTWPVDIVSTTTMTQAVYVVLTFSPKENFWITLNDAGILNPAAVVWETIPLSFVVDWFVGVGDFLNAQQALRLFSFKGGTATHVDERKLARDYTHRTRNGYTWCVPPSATHVECGGMRFNRQVLSSLDLSPSLYAGKGLNCVRSLDAISLLYSMFRGKRIGKLRI